GSGGVAVGARAHRAGRDEIALRVDHGKAASRPRRRGVDDHGSRGFAAHRRAGDPGGTMRKLPSLLLTFPLLFAIGWSAQIVAIMMRYESITEVHLRSAAVQGAIWLVMVIPAFPVLDVVLRRVRARILHSGSITGR